MMDRRLSENEIRYVLDHLSAHYTGPDMGEVLVYGESGASANGMSFPVSEAGLDENKVQYIDEIPVLFPCSDSKFFRLI